MDPASVQQPTPRELLSQHCLSRRIAAVKLDVLCQIDPHSCNLHHWTLLASLLSMVERTIVAH